MALTLITALGVGGVEKPRRTSRERTGTARRLEFGADHAMIEGWAERQGWS